MANSSGRRRRRQSADPDQLILPFEKPEPLRLALRSIDHRVAGVGPKRMRQICELLMAVWFCGQHNGCRAHRLSLLDGANRNSDSGSPVIGSIAALKRTITDATRLGLLRSEQSNGPSEREVDETRIAELVRLSRERRRTEKCATSEPQVSHDCAAGEPRPLLYTNHKTSKPNQSSETSSSSSRPTLSAGEEEVFLNLVLTLSKRGVVYAREAVLSGLENGCTLEQLRCRAWWWVNNSRYWPEESRARTLYLGIAKAVPGLPHDKGWGDKVARART